MNSASLHLVNVINKTKSDLALFLRFLLQTKTNDNKNMRTEKKILLVGGSQSYIIIGSKPEDMI